MIDRNYNDWKVGDKIVWEAGSGDPDPIIGSDATKATNLERVK